MFLHEKDDQKGKLFKLCKQIQNKKKGSIDTLNSPAFGLQDSA